jgi:hypothetical protein
MTPAGVTGYLENVLEGLIWNKIQLWELPPAVTAIYFYGESCARSDNSEVEQLKADRDRYYRAAARGGFGVPIIKSQGMTFQELEEVRKFKGGAL